MTAVKSVKAETRFERIAREKEAWIQDAISYMQQLDLFEFEVKEGYNKVPEWAHDLAESLYEGSIGLSGVSMTPQEAVDEELTYWGD